jgi:tetratricopeptide (TPR) repeat protein
MGVVYKARQTKLGRLVALKMILAGSNAGAEELARFKGEAQTMARLQHPNIVQVYEVGEHDGLPFLALELVEGGSLASRLAGTPQPPAVAAALVQALAGAVQHAHEHEVVHRDIKPGNVLLSVVSGPLSVAKSAEQRTTDNGQRTVPKITDFGLAKRLDAIANTRTGAFLGTLAYAAPEQVRGQNDVVGPPADIYALGVLLYECLTGRPPFHAPDPAETLRQVIDSEPVSPRALQPGVPRDLETICVKCLHKLPGRRYASAGELERDLGRFLAGQPILARRTPAWERAWMWTRRRPAVASLIAVSALALLALAVGGWRYKEAEAKHARQLAAAAQERAEELRREQENTLRENERAQENLRDACRAVNEMLSEVGLEQLRDVPQMEPVRRKLLERALAFYEKFRNQDPTDAELRYQMGMAQVRIGYILVELGDFQQAEKPLLEAQSGLLALVKEHPRPHKYRAAVGKVRNALANLRTRQRRYPEVERICREALPLWVKLTEEEPNDLDAHCLLAGCWERLAVALSLQEQRDEAIEACGRALVLRRALARANPNESRLMEELADSLNASGAVLMSAGKRDDAERIYRESLQVHAGLNDVVARSGQMICYTNLSSLAAAGGRQEEARGFLERSLFLLEGLVRDFPATPRFRLALANNRFGLGRLLMKKGEHAAAAASLAGALPYWRQLLQSSPDSTLYRRLLADTLHYHGVVLHRLGRPADSVAPFAESLSHYCKLVEISPQSLPYRRGLADVSVGQRNLLTGLNRWPEARIAGTRALFLYARLSHEFPARSDFRRARDGCWERLSELSYSLQLEGNHAESALGAEALGREFPARRKGFIRAAILLAGCAGAAGKDPRLSEVQCRDLARAYGDRTMLCLYGALQFGHVEVANVDRKEFRPVAGRADFQRLLAWLRVRHAEPASPPR